MRLAFDISSSCIGVCVMDQNKTEWILDSFVPEYDENNLWKVASEIKKEIEYLEQFVSPSEKLVVGLEVSNFRNPKLTQRFSLIAGMIIMAIEEHYKKIEVDYKVFNSNQWQSLIGCKPSDTREVRKQKSKEFYYQKNQIWNNRDDETDAFCIAYHLDMLNTTHQTHINAQNKAKQERTNKSTIAKLNKQIITRQEKLLKLKPSQIKMKARLENEINEIKDRISKIH